MSKTFFQTEGETFKNYQGGHGKKNIVKYCARPFFSKIINYQNVQCKKKYNSISRIKGCFDRVQS